MYIMLLIMSAALFLTGAFLAGKAYLSYAKAEGASYELFFLRSVIGCVLMALSLIVANTSATFHMMWMGS